jgi:hypothetical protein
VRLASRLLHGALALILAAAIGVIAVGVGT